MSETVDFDGVTLYAPILACRPVQLEDYPPERLRAHRAIEAEEGVHQDIYPGSTYVPCEACGIKLALGPRQQAAAERAAELGLAAHVLCMFDAAERAAASEAATAMSLGNPFMRGRP